MNSLFIFHRDLRLDDNTGLIKACHESSQVYPIFIINKLQVSDKNSYKSQNAIQFMHESLKELKDLTDNKISFFLADNNNNKQTETKILINLVKKLKIDKVYSNKDYTPYARKRDNEIKDVLDKEKVEFISTEDYTLTGLDEIKTNSYTFYTKYTPYKNKAKLIKVNEPVIFTKSMKNKLMKISASISSQSIDLNILEEKYYHKNININVNGGRSLGMKILQNSKKFKDYVENRNMLTYKTTFLSAYIKFGCVSLREVYYAFKKNIDKGSSFFDELYWHDFYAQAIYHNNKVLEGKSMDERFDKIQWTGTREVFNKWCNGETGFPVVDAAMKQLNTTGYMHNRARMIVASFLVKILMCNWRWGEKYFAQQLVDYDPSSNVGGWLWSAGGGFDSQPYFRIFNPWTQSLKFDPNAEYIKKWLPQLNPIPPKDIHNWSETYSQYIGSGLGNDKIKYIKPCVDYTANRVKTLEIYKKYL